MYPESLQKYIPPNFDVTKYEASKDMDLGDWFGNLMFRALIVDKSDKEILDELNGEVEMFGHDKPLMADKDIIENYRSIKKKSDRRLLDRYLKYGVILSKKATDEEIIEQFKGSERGYGYETLAVVRDVSLKEVMWCVESMPLMPNYQEFMKLYDYCHTATSDDEDRSHELDAFRPSNSVEGVEDVWLSVDFSNSDSEIKQAFDFWLKQTRKRVSGTKNKLKRREPKINQFSISTRRNWYMNKVLPYLDLVNWNHLQGNNSTSAILGEILFPNEPGSNGMIDDTVKPLAKKLTSKSIMDRMMNVIHEQNRQKITL